MVGPWREALTGWGFIMYQTATISHLQADAAGGDGELKNALVKSPGLPLGCRRSVFNQKTSPVCLAEAASNGDRWGRLAYRLCKEELILPRSTAVRRK